MASIELSRDEARRIAVAASGLAGPRPARVTPRHIHQVIRQLGLVQLDFVNSVTPAHYQVIFSRLGFYERRLLDDAVYRSGKFTEHWAHEASIVPVESWPLLRYRRESQTRPWGLAEFLRDHQEYSETVLAEIRARGPLCCEHMPDPVGTDRRRPDTWYRSVPRVALEAHFSYGDLAIRDRRADFSRVYDLAERLIPEQHFTNRVDAHDAQRQLLRQAARAYGIATAGDLADYFRMPASCARPRLAELRESGELVDVRLEGGRGEAMYLWNGTRTPKSVAGAALLSPFDPLVWYRKRVLRLFDFDYRFEIFIPDHKRRWGSYVLPFLLGDRLVARVDLKAERAAGKLLARAAFAEAGVATADVARALAIELRAWADWLGLARVVVGRKGDLARELGVAVRALGS